MICKTEECCGCRACYDICPKGCIEIKEDKHRALYAHINKELCTQCNLCRQVCPALNALLQPIKSAYAGVHKNEDTRYWPAHRAGLLGQ